MRLLAGLVALLLIEGDTRAVTRTGSVNFGAGTINMPARYVVGRKAEARVVILRSSLDVEALPEVERRVAAELSNLGLKVVSVPCRTSDLNGQLAEMGGQAVAHRALASIRVFRGKGHQVVQAWIYDSVTGKMVFRQLLLQREKGPDAMASAALQVVELLHASLLEVRMRRRREAARDAPPIVHKMVAARLDGPPRGPGRWSIRGGLWNAWSLGQAGSAGGVSLGMSWRPVGWLSLGGEVFAPWISSRVGDHRGTAQVTALMLRGVGWIEPFNRARVSPGLGVGAGSLLVGASGQAMAPNRAQTDWKAVALLSLSARLALRVSPSIRVLTAVVVDISFPEVAVLFGEDIVARIGRPLLAAALALEWSWGSQ